MKIGLRTFKSAIAVFIILMIFFVLKVIDEQLSTWFSPFFASIAACFSIHPDKASSLRQAKIRSIGTIIGGIIGMLIVWLCFDLKHGNHLQFFFYLTIVSLVILVLIPITVKAKFTTAVFVTLLTYLSITIGAHTIPEFQYGINRILSTFTGILIAFLINVVKLPRYRNKNVLVACALSNLSNAQQLNPVIKYKLNYLLEDGLDLVLTTHYSEPELDNLLKDVCFKNDIIVLNGAALYNYSNKTYNNVYNLSNGDKIKIEKVLEENNLFCLRYVVNHFNKLNVFFDKELPNHYLEIDESMEFDYIKAGVLEETPIIQYQFIDKLDKINEIENLFNKKDFLITIRKYNNDYYSLFINSINTSRVEQLNSINKYNKKVVSFLYKDATLSSVSDIVYSTVNSSQSVTNVSKEQFHDNLSVIKEIKKQYYKR